MVVKIDKARRNDQAGRIDDTRGLGSIELTDFYDFVADNSNITFKSVRT